MWSATLARVELSSPLLLFRSGLSNAGLRGCGAQVANGVKHGEGVPSHALGAVHGGVCSAHQLVGIDFVRCRIEDHAQTRSHDELLIEMPDGFRDCRQDSLHQFQGGSLIFELLKQDQELIATPAYDRVIRAHHVAYSARYHLQYVILDVVGVTVVDDLESVEVEERQRQQ